jgi:hypothetical protein
MIDFHQSRHTGFGMAGRTLNQWIIIMMATTHTTITIDLGIYDLLLTV